PVSAHITLFRIFLSLLRRPPRPPLFPYTTLFRPPGRVPRVAAAARQDGRLRHPRRPRGLPDGRPTRADGPRPARPVGPPRRIPGDRKSTRLTPVTVKSRMPSSA